VESQGPEARLHQPVALGLLELLLYLVLAHPVVASPQNSRPDEVGAGDNQRRDQDGRDRLHRQPEDSLGEGAGVVVHRRQDHGLLADQHHRGDASDRRDLDQALGEFDEAAGAEDAPQSGARRNA
jgi:hypothetical protein